MINHYEIRLYIIKSVEYLFIHFWRLEKNRRFFQTTKNSKFFRGWRKPLKNRFWSAKIEDFCKLRFSEPQKIENFLEGFKRD